MKIEIKKLSIQQRLSQETLCFSADIWVDGKKIGEVTNQGHGGCNNYYWSDAEKGKELEAYAKRTVNQYHFEHLDVLIDDIINKLDNEKRMKSQLKRWCKTQTVFTLKGDPIGEYRTVKAIFSPVVKTFLVNKYGDKIGEIINERL